MFQPPPPEERRIRPHLPDHDFEHVVGFFHRMGLRRAVEPLPPRLVWALYVLIYGFITIAVLTVLAAATGVPFVFPSVGPTAYMLFFSPRAESASPRNTIYGHGIGLVCGYVALWVSGIGGAHAGPGAVEWHRVTAAGFSLAVSGAIMVLAKVSHPPAGATTLIVSLGFITAPLSLLVIMAAVVLLVVQAFVINRLAGLPVPVWHAPPARPSGLRA